MEIMAKKSKADRADPRSNKSLAIRNVLEKMPKAKGAEIIAAVQSEYGHKVTPTLVYLVKSKAGVKASRRAAGKGKPATKTSNMEWIESIRQARRLLQSAGGLDNAVAILKAVEA
jgi:hypothetical protein